MKRGIFVSVGAALLLALLCLPAGVAAQQPDDGSGGAGEAAEIDRQAFQAAPDSPDITMITSTTPYCYQPDAGRNDCYINWNTISVSSGGDAYMRAVTITIGSRIRAVYRGFFQTSVYITYDMQGWGFKVPCGALGQSGDPTMGLGYATMIQAEDATGAKATNSGPVFCAGARLVFLPLNLRD